MKIKGLAPEDPTGQLFGTLFGPYDDQAYFASVEMFAKRFEANGFPLDWFRDKDCLDAGCGGGRYSVALSLLGARKVVGIDLSEEAILDARRRARRLVGKRTVHFLTGTIERIPYPDGAFDCVICSGVLHHTEHPERALAECARVLRSGGMLYALVYATGGIRWPMVQMLRPIVKDIEFKAMEEAVALAGLSAAKRRTYLDDLCVPRIDFYTWERLATLLSRLGFERQDRWEKGRLDHEESLESYLADLEGFEAIFRAGATSMHPVVRPYRRRFERCRAICQAALDEVCQSIDEVASGRPGDQEARNRVIGQGHHRVVTWKAGSN